MPSRPPDRPRRGDAVKTGRPAPSAGRVHIVFAASGRNHAVVLGAQLRHDGFEVTPLALTTNMVDVVRRSAPDVVLIVFTGQSFDLVRLCRDISTEINCRIVVVVADPPADDVELDDDLVIGTLDAGAHVVLPGTISSAVLAARLRAAIRTRPNSLHLT